MKKILFFSLCLCLVQGSSASAEPLSVGFDDLPRLVSSGNQGVLAGQAFADGAKAETGHLMRSFLPRVIAWGGGERFESGNIGTRTDPVAGVEGKLNLFRGGKDSLEEKIRRGQADIAKTELKRRGLEALNRARELYADALYYREGLSTLTDALSRTSGFSGAVRKKVEAGLVAESDPLELEIFRDRIKQQRALLEEDYEHSVNDLKVVLGLPLKTNLRLVTSKIKTSDWTLDPETHPEVLTLKEKTSIAHLKKKQASRWWAPSLDVYGGYSLEPYREREYADLNNRDDIVGGVRVSMDLFDGLDGASRSRSYGHQERGYALETEQRRRELEAHHERLVHELKTRNKLIGLLNQNIVRGRRYLDMSIDEYGRGIRSSSELFTALREHVEERQRLAETNRDYVRIKSELMMISGR